MTTAKTQATTEVLQALFDAFNRHDLEGVMSHMTADCVFQTAAGPEVCGTRLAGHEAVAAAFVQAWTTFPDAQWEDPRHFVAGDRAVSQWRFTGTRGDGARLEVDGCDLFTFRDGKIVLKDGFRKDRPPLAPAAVAAKA